MPFAIEPRDELSHDPVGDIVFRESFYFDAIDHESGIGLIGYFTSQPGTGSGLGFVHIAGPGGVIYSYRDFGFVVPSHEGGHNTSAVGPFRQTLVKEFERQTFSFDNGECKFDLEFSSNTAIYDYDWPWTNSRHYEQFGDAAVTIERSGEDPLVINGTALRDHAWGIRGNRPWRGWFWIISRSPDGGVSWSASWTSDEERPSDVFGFLIDADGNEFELLNVVAEFGYDGVLPTSAKLRMAFEDHPEVNAEIELHGHLDLSSDDPHKKGGYYFSLFNGQTDGKPSMGVFDIFSREDLGPWRNVDA